MIKIPQDVQTLLARQGFTCEGHKLIKREAEDIEEIFCTTEDEEVKIVHYLWNEAQEKNILLYFKSFPELMSKLLNPQNS